MYFLQNVTSQITQALNPLQDIAKALHDADKTNTNLVVATIILAVATIVFGTLSLLFTRWQVTQSEQRQEVRFQEQAKRQDDEHFERVRPWIVIQAPMPWQVVYKNNDSDPYETYMKIPKSERPEVDTISLTFMYSNKGQRVAHNLKEIKHFDFKEFTRQEFENMTEEDMHLSLAPQQEQSKSLRLKIEHWSQLNKTPVYLALRISYEDGKNRSVSGGIYKFSNVGPEIIETWYT